MVRGAIKTFRMTLRKSVNNKKYDPYLLMNRIALNADSQVVE